MEGPRKRAQQAESCQVDGAGRTPHADGRARGRNSVDDGRAAQHEPLPQPETLAVAVRLGREGGAEAAQTGQS